MVPGLCESQLDCPYFTSDQYLGILDHYSRSLTNDMRIGWRFAKREICIHRGAFTILCSLADKTDWLISETGSSVKLRR